MVPTCGSRVPGKNSGGFPSSEPPTSLEEDALSAIGEHNFEEIVRKLYPPVHRTMVEVKKVGEAHLTGSGSFVFAMYKTFIEAESAKLLLPDYIHVEWQMYVAQGCNKSPLHRSLQLLL